MGADAPLPQIMSGAAEIEDFQMKIFSTPFGRPRRETAVTESQGCLKKNLTRDSSTRPAAASITGHLESIGYFV